MRSAVSKSGDNSSLAGREEGMEKPKLARRRKSDTAKADLKPPLAVPGGQGVCREAESEGHAEKYRAVIEGRHPEDELVGRGWGKVEPTVWRIVQKLDSFTIAPAVPVANLELNENMELAPCSILLPSGC
jgi:hypothetical protein